MNIRDLQYLIAVHDLKNFSKAAEQCFVSQPTLSGQLKKLEQELGASLIERSTRQVLFTQLGEQVVEQAREILLSVQHIRDLATHSKDPMTGDLHLGLIPTVGPFLLPKIMQAISDQYPALNLYLYELQTEILIERLQKGELDAAILAKLEWEHSLPEMPIYSEQMKLAVAKNDPIAELNQPVDRDVLNGRRVLMLEDGHCLRDQAMGVCFAAGAKEDQRFKATSLDTLLHMVASGAGITLVPELACNEQLSGVRYLSFGAQPPCRDIVLLHRPKSSRLESLEKLVKLISECVATA